MELPNLAALTLCTGTRYSHVAPAAPQARSDADDDEIAAAWLAMHSGVPAQAQDNDDASSEATQMDEEQMDAPAPLPRFDARAPLMPPVPQPRNGDADEARSERPAWLPADYNVLGRADPAPMPPPPPRPAQPPAHDSTQRFAPWQGPWLMQGYTETRPKLYVAQTSLRDGQGHKLDQLGVFCYEHIEAGQFICAFTGTFMPKRQFDRAARSNKEMRRHAVQLDFENVDGNQEESQMLFALRSDETAADFARLHVAQCLNEPQKGMQANVRFFHHQFLPNVRKEEYYHAVLVYAAYPIAAHSEIFLHYGAGYAKERARNKYEAGAPADWDSALRPSPPMDDVLEAILVNGERIDETLFKESELEGSEVLPSGGSRSRPR